MTNVNPNIITAITSDKSLSFIYTDEDGVTAIRNIRPVSLKRAKNGNVLVKGLDLNRKETRQFVVDRIGKVGEPI